MNIQKNCIIVHGCEYDEQNSEKLAQRTAENHWTVWVREELNARGISSQTPLMPKSWAPEYKAFTSELGKYEVTEHTILVGHSCSCAFLVRWLGETKKKIAKLVLVAPWKVFDGTDAGRVSFYSYVIDPTIVDRVGEIIMFTADNESDDGKRSLQIFHDVLGGKVVSLDGKGHYRTSQWQSSAFPELVETII